MDLNEAIQVASKHRAGHLHERVGSAVEVRAIEDFLQLSLRERHG